MEKNMSGYQDEINSAIEENGVQVTAPVDKEQSQVLTPSALRFVAALSREFEETRRELLGRREIRQQEIEDGIYPDFLEETKHIRSAEWNVAPIPKDLLDRRVEITGPVDRKMIINALNSGANVYMADFEDSNAPTWHNNIQGQVNLRDAVNRTISFTNPEGKEYRLGNKTATLVVRPRGWHLDEKHVIVDGQPVSGSIFDFGLYFFHNARTLMAKGTGPYFYLPKLESHLEARLWNEVFNMAQDALGIPRGTIRATVLIETILAAFEMDEILFELRHHSSGLNCGRWDYIFSFIKRFRDKPDFVLPDRGLVTMDRHFLNSYVELLIKTCHRRGIHAMGGMAAQIPIKSDPLANAAALQKVRDDKLREVKAGHDGTWVAHPGLVPVAKEIFDAHMDTPNQIHKSPNGLTISAEDLLSVPDGDITEAGLRHNINVGILYLEAWLGGNGCVPIYNLMEDAATAEISRSQVWQWVHHRASLSNGRLVTRELVQQTISQELQNIRENIGDERYQSSRFDTAACLFEQMMTSDDFPEFMPLVAYGHLD
jgi:malate synthase